MVSGTSMEMLSEMGIRPLVTANPAQAPQPGFHGQHRDAVAVDEDEDLGKEIGLLLREQRRQEAVDRERELNIYRSGSAPPSVDGSLTGLFGATSARFPYGGAGGAGVGHNAAAPTNTSSSNSNSNNGFLTEEELRADPAYLEYYYSHVNLNPRLPPPVLSKEDWRFAQRLQVGGSGLGGIGDRRKTLGNNNNVNNNISSNKASAASDAIFSSSSQQMRSAIPENDKVRNNANANASASAAAAGEWLNKDGDGLIGLPGLALGGARQKSFADIFQDTKPQPALLSGHLSRPASRNAFDSGVNTLGSAEAQLGCLDQDISKVDGQRVSANGQHIQPIGPLASQTFASVLGSSLPRSKTPDPPLLARAPSPGLPPVGVKMNSTTADKKSNNGPSFGDVPTSFADSADIISGLSGLNLSRNARVDDDHYQSNLHEDLNDPQSYLFDSQGAQGHAKQHAYVKRTESGHLHSSSMAQSVKSSYPDLSNSSLMPEGQSDFQRPVVSSTNSYLKVPAAASTTSPGGSPVRYPNNDGAAFANPGFGGYSVNPSSPSMLASIGTGSLPPLFESAAAASLLSPGLESRFGAFPTTGTNIMDMQNLNRLANYAAATGLQMPLIDPLYMQYLRTTDYASQLGSNLNDPSLDRNYTGNAYPDILGLQKAAYLGSLLSSQNQYNVPFLGKSNSLNQGYYANPGFGLGGLSYPGSPVANPARSASGSPGSPLNRHTERNLRFPSGGMRNLNAAGLGSWNLDGGGSITENFTSSLLEEFKSSKTKTFELSEIAGHVVEFSADQYGSRFIQQKLETATTEEKNMVFEEIMPQALSLMTDVFGNYVIQKFFEHGTPAQTRELANQLTGHVLTLSLQMYGCRVIQKAIEVVELDQQTKMVAELDGQVMRCVRDQNGNHVIQKCIECIPQDAIQFIISSFYDQVVTLSTHPYGCRVIQRVLEHCDDPKTQQIVMDEIMQCVCMLAQDQYGNYVVQHVLQYGKPHERSAIIKQLAGQIVQMSQQKFASNVVEKCLTFGGPDERKLLVDEMLGTTDENEPLQAMMKDQFANYVVQKVLETCDDQQRELILSRIKVHLNALKKYTYGKHIVARVEKLVAAGERRTGVQTQYPS